MHTKRASTAQSTFFAHHEEEFNLHIGYELVRDRRDDAFLVSGPVGLLKIKWGLPNAHQNLIKISLLFYYWILILRKFSYLTSFQHTMPTPLIGIRMSH